MKQKQQLEIADAVASLLKEMHVESSITRDPLRLRLGANDFNSMICINPADPDWRYKVAVFFAGGTPQTRVVFAPLELPRIARSRHVRDVNRRVLLRWTRAYDVIEDRFIERYDGLCKILHA